MEVKLVNLVAIVNEGFSEQVMDLAKSKGARGGTVISATGSITNMDAQQLYGLSIQPEKEVVLILISEELAQPILSSFYDQLGGENPAQGIFFTLPVAYASENILKQYETQGK